MNQMLNKKKYIDPKEVSPITRAALIEIDDVTTPIYYTALVKLKGDKETILTVARVTPPQYYSINADYCEVISLFKTVEEAKRHALVLSKVMNKPKVRYMDYH